jgi:hypothetical protein
MGVAAASQQGIACIEYLMELGNMWRSDDPKESEMDAPARGWW